MSQELYLNGIDADTGGYAYEQTITAEQLANLLINKQVLPKDSNAEHDKDLTRRKFRDDSAPQNEDGTIAHFGTAEGIDSNDLSQTGWGVIFPAGLTQSQVDSLKNALKPLLDHRKKQAASQHELFYQEFIGPDRGLKNGESKSAFLNRMGAPGAGAVDPADGVPYYLLLVGSPETIPFSFQYQLDVQYAVGRIYFDKLEDYFHYAQSVVAAETGKIKRAQKAAFFGVANPDDRATQMSAEHLIKPLFSRTQDKHKNWKVNLVPPEKATKANLGNYLGGKDTPALLFTASHGMNFKYQITDPVKLQRDTGALLCQDWPGPKVRQQIKEDLYFSAADIASDADVFGMIAFIFACYGGGIPKMDNFYQQAFGDPKQIAPYAFLSQLPTRLLSHPKGSALGVFAHVERAWGTSILEPNAPSVSNMTTFRSMTDTLLKGETVGMATEYFNSRYAELSSELTTELDGSTTEVRDEVKLANLWTSNNDARNYTFLGDPAVRLPVDKSPTPAARLNEERVKITVYPTSVKNAKVSFQPDVVDRSPAAPAATGSTPSENFGLLDGFKKPEPPATGEAPAAATSSMGESLKGFIDKVGAYLSKALDDTTSLEVATYVADDLATVKYTKDAEGQGRYQGAQLRAMTRISLDGDTLVCVPEKDGEIDTAVWEIHLEMVKAAQENRAALVKTIVEAATSIANPAK